MKPKRTKHQHQYGYTFGTRFTSLKRVLIVDASGIMLAPAIPLWHAANQSMSVVARKHLLHFTQTTYPDRRVSASSDMFTKL